jgi:hypothetical protein
VRAVARVSRLGLLAVLLVLSGAPVAVAPGADGAGQYQVSVAGRSMPAAPPARDDLRDWLRLSTVARHGLATAAPDTWGALCPRVAGGCPLRGRLPAGAAGATGMAVAVPPPYSSRAPPRA